MVHRLRLNAATGPYWPKGARKKKILVGYAGAAKPRDYCLLVGIENTMWQELNYVPVSCRESQGYAMNVLELFRHQTYVARWTDR